MGILNKWLLSIVLLAPILTACGGTTSPGMTAVIPDAGQGDLPTTTSAASIPPTDTAVPTADIKMAATPTVPPPLMTPGYAIEEADYRYYEQLMLMGGDSNPPVEISKSYGVNIAGTSCGACDLGIGTVLETFQTEKNISISAQIVLYRFASMELVQERIPQEIAGALETGDVQEAVPDGFQLPAETYIFTMYSGGTGVRIISFYEGFEIYLIQGTLADMTKDELVEFFCRLVELQISKLVAAGY